MTLATAAAAWRRHADLWVAVGIAAALAWTITAAPEAPSVARVGLAFLVVLLAPGYALQVALFPRRTQVGGVERVALSLGFSVVVIPPTGAMVAATGAGIAPAASAWALTAIVALLAAAAALRRRGVAPEERFVLTPGTRGLGGVLGTGAALLFLGGTVVALAGWLAPAGPETEFYVLGEDDTLEAYPRQLTPGQRFTLTPGIVNHDAAPRSYLLRFPFSHDADLDVGPLPPGGAWEGTVTLTAPEERGCVRLDLLLYRDDDVDAPHRRLHVNLPVLDEPSPTPWQVCR